MKWILINKPLAGLKYVFLPHCHHRVDKRHNSRRACGERQHSWCLYYTWRRLHTSPVITSQPLRVRVLCYINPTCYVCTHTFVRAGTHADMCVNAVRDAWEHAFLHVLNPHKLVYGVTDKEVASSLALLIIACLVDILCAETPSPLPLPRGSLSAYLGARRRRLGLPSGSLLPTPCPDKTCGRFHCAIQSLC